MEEVGKAWLCIQFMIDDDYNDVKKVKKFKDVFESHTQKTLYANHLDIWIVKILFKGNKNDALKFLQESLLEEKAIEKLNYLKNCSLYTFYSREGFKTPSQVITNDNVEKIRIKAHNRLKIGKSSFRILIESINEIIIFMKTFTSTQELEDEMAKDFWNEIDNVDS